MTTQAVTNPCHSNGHETRAADAPLLAQLSEVCDLKTVQLALRLGDAVTFGRNNGAKMMETNMNMNYCI